MPKEILKPIRKKQSRQRGSWRGFICRQIVWVKAHFTFRVRAILLLGFLFLFVLFLPYFFAEVVYFAKQGSAEIFGEEEIVAHVTMESNWVLVPSLDIAAPVIYVTEKSEDVYQEALQNGVVHYPTSASPGEPGNVYIFGHSSDFLMFPGNYKTIFATLPHIEIGADIIISDGTGIVYTYRVIETKIVNPKDLSVLDQGDGTTSLLTLQTSYPLGTALKRFVVIAELVD
ncbi:MAG: sortase [Patescibacteria group bacterium]|jgi:sortase A